jgi:YNFM family putative membrane transporter
MPDAVFIRPGTAEHRRASIALFLAGFATFSLLYCVQPLLPVLARSFAVSPAAAALALSISTAAMAVAVVAAGALSEAWGRRGLMAAALTAASLLNIAAALASYWPLLLLLRALEGVALGGVPAVAIAYLAEEIEPSALGRAMGLYVSGTAVGGMCGRVITGILSEEFGWRPALGGIGVIGLGMALGFVLLLPQQNNFVRRHAVISSHHLRAWRDHILHGKLPLLFAIGGLSMGSFVTVYNYLGFRLEAPPYSLNQTEAGLIFTVYLVGMVSSTVAGTLADRLGRLPALATALGLGLAGLAVSLLVPLAAVVLGIAMVTGGFFAAHAVASGWVGRLANESKGHAASLYLLVYYIGSSVMGSAGGWFWSAHGWGGIVALTGASLTLALMAALGLRGAPD